MKEKFISSNGNGGALKTPKEQLDDLFQGYEVIPVRPFMARALGIEAALFVAQAIYWQVHAGPGNWFYKRRDAERAEGARGGILPPSSPSKQSWEWELGLPRRSQELARKQLRGAGLLEEKYMGIPRQLYFRVDLDAVAEFVRTNGQPVKSAHTDGRGQPTKRPVQTNKVASNGQLSHRVGKDHPETISSSFNAAAEKTTVIILNAEDDRRHQSLLAAFGQDVVTLAVNKVVDAGKRPYVSNVEKLLRSGVHGNTNQSSAEDRLFAEASAAAFGFTAIDVGGYIINGEAEQLN